MRTGDKGLKLKMFIVWVKTSKKEYLLQGRKVLIEQKRENFKQYLQYFSVKAISLIHTKNITPPIKEVYIYL